MITSSSLICSGICCCGNTCLVFLGGRCHRLLKQRVYANPVVHYTGHLDLESFSHLCCRLLFFLLPFTTFLLNQIKHATQTQVVRVWGGHSYVHMAMAGVVVMGVVWWSEIAADSVTCLHHRL